MFGWIRKRFEDFLVAGVLQELAHYGCGKGTVEPLDDEFPGIRNVWRARVEGPRGEMVERFGFGPFRALRAVRDHLEFRATILADQVRAGCPPVLPERIRRADQEREWERLRREKIELLS